MECALLRVCLDSVPLVELSLNSLYSLLCGKFLLSYASQKAFVVHRLSSESALGLSFLSVSVVRAVLIHIHLPTCVHVHTVKLLQAVHKGHRNIRIQKIVQKHSTAQFQQGK